jgi:hypothetical protein
MEQKMAEYLVVQMVVGLADAKVAVSAAMPVAAWVAVKVAPLVVVKVVSTAAESVDWKEIV